MIQVTGETASSPRKTIHELEVFISHAKYRLQHFSGVLHIQPEEIVMLDDALTALKKDSPQ